AAYDEPIFSASIDDKLFMHVLGSTGESGRFSSNPAGLTVAAQSGSIQYPAIQGRDSQVPWRGLPMSVAKSVTAKFTRSPINFGVNQERRSTVRIHYEL